MRHETSPVDLKQFDLSLRHAAELGDQIIDYLRGCVEDTIFETQGARIMCGSLWSLSETVKLALQLSLSWPEKRSLKRDDSSDGSDVTAVATSAFDWDVDKILNVRYPDTVRQRPKVVIDHRDVSVSTDPQASFCETSPTVVEPPETFPFDPEPIPACVIGHADMATETEPCQEPTNGHDDRSESVRKEGPLSKLRRKKSMMKKNRDSASHAEPPPLPCNATQTDSCADHVEHRPDVANDPEEHPEGARKAGKFKSWMMKTLEPTSEVHPPTPLQAIDEPQCPNESGSPDLHESMNDLEEHPDRDGGVRKEGKLRSLIKSKSLSKKAKDKEDKTAVDDHMESTTKKEHDAGGAAKLKAWIKRKLLHRKVKIVWDVEDEVDCAVGREVKQRLVPPRVLEDYWQTYEMNSHHISQTFPAVSRDMQAIGRRLSSVCCNLLVTHRLSDSRPLRSMHV